jgi:DNA polymerase
VASAIDFRTYYLREAGVCPSMAGMSVADAEPLSSGASPERQGGGADLGSLATAVSQCTACGLAAGRTQTVFGVGNPEARLMFVGEAPGREEDLCGEPFVGQAGKLLDRMLAAMGLDRSQVYIMNVVKCRPPQNRNPESAEIEACSRWFDAQWQTISPSVVCLLGKVAASTVLGSQAPMTAMRGQWFESRGAKLRVTYHPAYLLRSPGQKVHVWEDMQAIMRALREEAA